MVALMALGFGLALIFAITFCWCFVLADKKVSELGSEVSTLTAERDAARHDAHEYKADAADLQKKHDKERDLRKAAEERASRMAQALDTLTDENTKMRTDLHLLSNKWK